jgi:hypothetical protein
MKTMKNLLKKSAISFMILAFAVGSFGYAPAGLQAATTWDLTGDYVINMNLDGTDYAHDVTFSQDSSGNLTGSGGSPSGANTYEWEITSGTVTDNTINFTANYTATADAVTPLTTMNVTGTIAENGTISGTWSDNYQGGEREGTFSTASGAAVTLDTTSRVTILKYVDGSLATGASADNTDFQMNATWTINGTPGTGEYTLSETGYNGDPTPYQAMTSELPDGSTYGTNEIMNDITGATCAAGKPYALTGYAWGNTLAEARAATPSLTPPVFTNIQSDKVVIVLNDDCSTENVGGEIGGEVVEDNGTLAVTSIEQVDTSATANNSFEDGWKYVFNITVPTDETDVSMKFGNWSTTGGGSIATANNIRISSPQANNSGATVTITGADTYSTPAFTITGDLDPEMAGNQIKVTVEVKIPTGTASGSYTTTYGVQSQ